MSETERVAAVCPACTPEEETAHEVLNAGGQATVRCTECGHVHKVRISKSDPLARDVIVSQEGESYQTTAQFDPESPVRTGDEFLVETPEAIQQVRVTAIELAGGNRVEETAVQEVDTLWTRVVDNVAVPVTVHPSDGRRD